MLYFFVGTLVCMYACLEGITLSMDRNLSSEVNRILKNSVFVEDDDGKLPAFYFASLVRIEESIKRE